MSQVSIAAAFWAGILSFVSPCVLPLVPGYLSLMTGVSAREVKEGAIELKRLVASIGLFMLGFTAVFVALFASVSSISSVLVSNRVLLNRVAGGLILAMAVLLIVTGLGKYPFFLRERRFQPKVAEWGLWAAPVMGAAFAFGWSPCIGPILGAVLATASVQASIGRGIVLLIAYSFGLGLPFLVVGLAAGRMVGVFDWFKRHHRGLSVVSGSALAAFGILMLLNKVGLIAGWIQEGFRAIGLDGLTGI